MDNLTAKVAAAVSVAAGFGILYYPPELLGVGPGTVAFATTLIFGGFTGLGLALGIPALRTSARREGMAMGRENPVTRARPRQ